MPFNYSKKGTKEAIAADIASIVADKTSDAAQVEAVKALAIAEVNSVKSNGVIVNVRASHTPQRQVSVNVSPFDLVV